MVEDGGAEKGMEAYIHYPSHFFSDGYNRQEKQRKLSGKTIRDGNRQG